MKIVHVNTYDVIGGAARSAHRLHRGLRAAGEDSVMFVFSAQNSDPGVVKMVPCRSFRDRLSRRIRERSITRDYQRYRDSRPDGYEPFQDCRSPFRSDFQRQLPSCDILNLHWVANSFLDYESFFAGLPPATRVVWTLHDMNPFTGGCHYDLGCDRFTDSCGGCPQLGSADPEDLSHQIWQRKANAFAHMDPSRLQFVSPSRWLAGEIRRSPLTKHFPVSVIPYGLDLNDFAPRNQAECRAILGLPAEAKVCLFVADGLDNERKGFGLLTEALAALPRSLPVALLSVGRCRPDADIQVPWVHAGSVGNDRLMSVLYSAADVFVIPSLQDNLPNTVLEAMACGTPVVGFSVGGIPDMVQPGISGALVPAKDVAALSDSIAQLLGNPELLRQMRVNCRRIAVEEYPLDLQASRYASLYRATLGVQNFG